MFAPVRVVFAAAEIVLGVVPAEKQDGTGQVAAPARARARGLVHGEGRFRGGRTA